MDAMAGVLRDDKRWEPPPCPQCGGHLRHVAGCVAAPAPVVVNPSQSANKAEADREFGEIIDKAIAEGRYNPLPLMEPIVYGPGQPRLAVGVKHDTGKLRYDLVPAKALAEVVAVLTHGASKYDDENWYKVLKEPNGPRRYYAAVMRHLEAWRQGEVVDKETGLHHLAHATCCLMFLQYSDDVVK